MNNDITITCAFIAALGAILAPSIAAIITARYQFKTKTVALLFDAKIAAYSHFNEIAGSYPEHATEEDQLNLNTAASQAIMLSSAVTQSLISLYVSALIGRSTSLGERQAEALLAMQHDLVAFNGYFRRKDFNARMKRILNI